MKLGLVCASPVLPITPSAILEIFGGALLIAVVFAVIVAVFFTDYGK